MSLFLAWFLISRLPAVAISLVRIRETPDTIAAGVAGIVGAIYGYSMPSGSGVSPIIGPVPDDFVLNVWVDERRESYWLAPELLDNLGDGSGQTSELEGVPVTWTRQRDGTWAEHPVGTEPGQVTDPSVLRSLWTHIRGEGGTSG